MGDFVLDPWCSEHLTKLLQEDGVRALTTSSEVGGILRIRVFHPKSLASSPF